jgi:Icc-related predicted phosphoesterase
MSDDTPFTCACIGDLHVREEEPNAFRELFGEVSKQAAVLVLCGDLTDAGTPRQAEILAEQLRACTIPIVGVLGNHDYETGHADEVRDILKHAGVKLLDGQSCEVDGVAFVGAKASLAASGDAC